MIRSSWKPSLCLLRIRAGISELSGLERDSDIMIDKLTTIRRSHVHSRVAG